MPGLVSVGATVRPLRAALKEINAGTGGYFGEPEDYHLASFALEWSDEVDDVWSVHDKLRRNLDYYVDAKETSYFRCSPEDVRSALKAVLKQARTD